MTGDIDQAYVYKYTKPTGKPEKSDHVINQEKQVQLKLDELKKVITEYNKSKAEYQKMV
eukprot:NODE_11031_length_317_cov_37.783582_g10118_i0.p2 GENE.NODE_11031_length_317_cov_37.783582_g10118_i0~~NODE_11031_length_317_cov_37.783582_g10118_i0.p2  ORF type:complete len:59 (-),score=6.01 NODE_11031_length_317_cov_37.783582_g10118_i0:97-273(-)